MRKVIISRSLLILLIGVLIACVAGCGAAGGGGDNSGNSGGTGGSGGSSATDKTYTITVKVYDAATSTPLAGAEVCLGYADCKTTNGNGEYHHSATFAGQWGCEDVEVEVFLDGYKDAKMATRMCEDGHTTYIYLHRS